ncbi:MAG: DUF3575 domain-containing protein [Bacteroidales bacterium]
MKTTTKIVPICMMMVSFSLRAQSVEPDTYDNAIKINSIALYFRNVSLQYERRLNDHWAILGGAGFKWGGKIPKVVGLGDVVVTSSTSGLRGYNLTPELRYYFNFCDCGGTHTGFYAGLYTRYTRFYGDLTFNFWDGTQYADVCGAGNMREFGAGIQLGYQFVFKKRFIVDLMFAGPRTSFQRVRFSVDSHYAADLIPAIEEEINKRLEWLGHDPISIPVSADTEVKFNITSFRYALGIGYIF